MEKAVLLELLSTSAVSITFTKKDGSERTMLCTRFIDAIPADKRPKGDNSTETGDNIRVFDLEKQDWRSFNFTSLKA